MCKMKDNLVKQALFSYNYIVERKAVKVETTKKQKRKNNGQHASRTVLMLMKRETEIAMESVEAIGSKYDNV